jgi:hypothetical protein
MGMTLADKTMSNAASLFETPSFWQEEWKGMPEIVQPKIKPYAEIIVRFETEDALREFSEIIGQKLTAKTQGIWHPKLIPGQQSGTHLRYVDESAISNIRHQ